VVSKVVKKCKVQVVESSTGCCSLHRKTSKGFDVCLLIKEKTKSNVISIEGKSNSDESVKRIIKDIKKLFVREES